MAPRWKRCSFWLFFDSFGLLMSWLCWSDTSTSLGTFTQFFKNIVVVILESAWHFFCVLMFWMRTCSLSIWLIVTVLRLGSRGHSSIACPNSLQHRHLVNYILRLFFNSNSSSSSSSSRGSCFWSLHPFCSTPFLRQHHQRSSSLLYSLLWVQHFQLKFWLS